MKVVLVAFHGDDGPPVDHNWEMTSIEDEGSVIFREFREVEDEGM